MAINLENKALRQIRVEWGVPNTKENNELIKKSFYFHATLFSLSLKQLGKEVKKAFYQGYQDGRKNKKA